jgi:hypothetical protein
VDDPRVQAGQTLFKTSFTYNASNQLISQTQLSSFDGPADYATTRIYYDALGRQVGVRDANGNLNARSAIWPATWCRSARPTAGA